MNRVYVGRHERPTPPMSSDRAANAARAADVVGRPCYQGRHENRNA